MSVLVSAALAALVALAAPDLDTVMLRDGGRLRGTVMEETRSGGVIIQLPDGRVEKLAPDQVSRVVYSDGAVGILGVQAPAAAAPATPTPSAAPAPTAAPDAEQAQPPAAAPEPPGPAALAPPPPPPPPPPPFRPAPVYRPEAAPLHQLRPPSLFMLAGGLGLAVPFGDAEKGVPMSDLIQPQFLLELELGLRLTPAFMLGLLLDVGVGDVTSKARSACQLAWGSSDCSGVSAHFVFQARYTFMPYAPATPWVALGVGSETAGIGGSGSSNQLMYSGAQFPRLSAGFDWRGEPYVGWGVFGTLAFGRYSTVRDSGTDYDLSSRASHGWFMVGVRAILGP